MPRTVPDPLLSRLSDLLAEHMGLHFPRERWGDLERGITAAAPAFQATDAKSCAYRLVSAPLTHHEIEILASCLTVGETYFFRDRSNFEALEQNVLPELLHARERTERRLRIWSAGCCTGEEPYSIAMLLDRLIPNPEAWNTTLLGTDINPEFLRKAAQGEYGEWSFRSTPDWVRERYFQRNRTGRFDIQARIRKRVSFAYLNLADDTYPSLTNNTNAMDVILCRNVLMYFTAGRARLVADNLHRALVDGGWLIVSPAETSSALFPRFTPVSLGGTVLYRKTACAQAPRLMTCAPSAPAEPGRTSWCLPPRPLAPLESVPESPPGRAADTVAQSRHADPPAPTECDRLSRAARDCANQGQLGEATAWCRKAIAANKLNPACHYLLATILQEQGQNEEAVHSLTRALYLDPDFVLAHFALGNLRRLQGRRRQARRHFDNALASLRAHPPDDILPESDGLTADRLGEIIASTQSSIS